MTPIRPEASIIICTRDRAGALAQTLASLAQVCVPADMPCELLIVDNGSTDGTAQVAQEYRLPNMPVRYLWEERPGQCHARNTGVAAAQGRVIVFTDDDLRFPQDWLAGMCGPILSGEADAVAGGVSIAPSLIRPWMTSFYRDFLASTENVDPQDPWSMIGANMAFGRHVLARVPAFDPELGPGALGFYDEVLFSWQLKRAGFRLIGALSVTVEHHFDESRLLRQSFLDRMKKEGQSLAYIDHHWRHRTHRAVRLRMLWRACRLYGLRLLRPDQTLSPEGAPPWELEHQQGVEYYRQYLKERRRPRRYEEQGLVKLTHE